jgi:two-component system sensor histidine kinase MprB
MTATRMVQPRSLRSRFALAIGIVIAVVVVATLAASNLTARRQLDHNLDSTLVRAATELQLAAKHDAQLPASGLCQYLAAPACSQVIAASGTGVSGPLLPVTAQARAVARGQAAPYFGHAVVAGLPVRTYVAPLGPGSAVEVALRSDQVSSALSRLQAVSALIGAIAVLLGAALAYLLSRAGLRPLRRLAATAEHIATDQDLSRRVRAGGPEEIARLSRAVNTMLTALDVSMAKQRQLVADASHELRRPLAGIRANAQLLLDSRLDLPTRQEVRDALTSGIDEVSALMTDIIELARDGEATLAREDLRLDLLASRAIRTAQRRWPAHHFAASLQPALINADADRLMRLVANLLDNAAKFSQAASRIDITVAGAAGPGGAVRLAIGDHGSGIDARDLPRIFDRFYRSAEARSKPGSGLGLAIAHQVATQHGATIEVTSTSDGTQVTVLFPSPGDGTHPPDADRGGAPSRRLRPR